MTINAQRERDLRLSLLSPAWSLERLRLRRRPWSDPLGRLLSKRSGERLRSRERPRPLRRGDFDLLRVLDLSAISEADFLSSFATSHVIVLLRISVLFIPCIARSIASSVAISTNPKSFLWPWPLCRGRYTSTTVPNSENLSRNSSSLIMPVSQSDFAHPSNKLNNLLDLSA